MVAVLIVRHSVPLVSALDLIITAGILILGLALTANRVWTAQTAWRTWIVALVIAVVLTGAVIAADASTDSVYHLYCDGWYGWTQLGCWF